MSQTKTGSVTEAFSNVAIGFGLNFTLNLLLLPIMWDAAAPAASAFRLGLVFTVVSVVRSYILRRWFNQIRAKWNQAQIV